MKRITMAVLAAAGFTMAVASPAAAQGTTLGVGVGITNPMGNWKDKNVWGDKMGFHFGLGASFALGSAPVRARIEGTYTKASHDGFAGSTKLLGGMASLVYPFQTAGNIKPYVLAGIGVYNIKESVSDSSETKVGFGGGGGVRFPMSSMSVFVEARYLTTGKAFGLAKFSQLPITVGVSFPLGAKK